MKIRTLNLTTPETRGLDVKELQTILRDKTYYRGAIDGEYGILTAQATFRAKFKLGYAKPNKTAGQRLYDYLTGVRKPGLIMEQRAKKRKPKPGILTPRMRMAKKALSQLGVEENPANSNHVKFGEWYGMDRQAWCFQFVTWAGADFIKALVRGRTYAFVPFAVADARAGRNHLTIAHDPLTGVIVTFDWEHDGRADHVGICVEEKHLEKWAAKALVQAKKNFGSLSSGDFWTVEGNTAVGNDSNGGKVMIRKRNRRLVAVFINAT